MHAQSLLKPIQSWTARRTILRTPCAKLKLASNKTLKKLRDQQVVVWSNGRLEVINYDRLCDIAQLDPARDPVIRPLL